MSEWLDITRPSDLEQCNATAVARVLSGFVFVKTWWNPRTKAMVTRMYTQAGVEKAKAVSDE